MLKYEQIHLGSTFWNSQVFYTEYVSFTTRDILKIILKHEIVLSGMKQKLDSYLCLFMSGFISCESRLMGLRTSLCWILCLMVSTKVLVSSCSSDRRDNFFSESNNKNTVNKNTFNYFCLKSFSPRVVAFSTSIVFYSTLPPPTSKIMYQCGQLKNIFPAFFRYGSPVPLPSPWM